MTPLLFVAGFAVVGAFLVHSFIAAKKRREAFVAACAVNNWSHVERDDSVLDTWHGDEFGRGHNRKARNVVHGTHAGRTFTAFDYTYYTTETKTDSKGHTTRHEQAHNYGVVGLDLDVWFPELEVRPEGVVGRAFGRLTNTDIQFESEDFNRAFTVTCPDRKFASDVLHPRMMELLLAHPDVNWEFQNNRMVSISSGTFTVEEIQSRLDVFATVLELIPSFVWEDPDQNTPTAGA